MNKKINLSEIVRDRANELRIRALLYKMLKATNNNFPMVIEHIKNIASFMDFDYEIQMKDWHKVLDKVSSDSIISISRRFKEKNDDYVSIKKVCGVK